MRAAASAAGSPKIQARPAVGRRWPSSKRIVVDCRHRLVPGSRNLTSFHGQVELVHRVRPKRLASPMVWIAPRVARAGIWLFFEVGRVAPPTRLPGTPLSTCPPSDTAVVRRCVRSDGEAGRATYPNTERASKSVRALGSQRHSRTDHSDGHDPAEISDQDRTRPRIRRSLFY
jgi:hypothetical protein